MDRPAPAAEALRMKLAPVALPVALLALTACDPAAMAGGGQPLASADKVEAAVSRILVTGGNGYRPNVYDCLPLQDATSSTSCLVQDQTSNITGVIVKLDPKTQEVIVTKAKVDLLKTEK